MTRTAISCDAEEDEDIMEAAGESGSKVEDSEMQFQLRGRRAARTDGGKRRSASAPSAVIPPSPVRMQLNLEYSRASAVVP